MRRRAYIALLLIGAGCEPTVIETAGLPQCVRAAPCASGADCLLLWDPNDAVCVDGACVGDTCAEDADCRDGHVCVLHDDASGTRVCARGQRCVGSDDCVAGACRDGLCDALPCEVTGCAADEVCEPGSACRAVTCAEDGDCEPHQGCQGGRCVSRTCASECPEGQGCARLDGVYQCLRTCGADCDCNYDPAYPKLCVEGRCVEVNCVDGRDFGCPFGFRCQNARETLVCPPPG